MILPDYLHIQEEFKSIISPHPSTSSGHYDSSTLSLSKDTGFLHNIRKHELQINLSTTLVTHITDGSFKMILKISAIILILLTLCSCSLTEKTTKNIDASSNNKTLNSTGYFNIGGFYGKTYYVKINNNTLTYTVLYGGVKKTKRQILSNSELLKLEKMFKNMNADNWKNEYSDSSVMHGALWSIKYFSKNIRVDSKGYASFPENFSEVMNYISKSLLKGQKFG